jgi:hypothetical protein
MKIISIVTQLLPKVDGVGDYALALARQMRKFSIDTHFIVCNTEWQGDFFIDEGITASKISSRSSMALVEELEKYQDVSSVLVNYVLHAYSPKGCPFWLINGLTVWRSNNSQCNLVTMFHEAYADLRGPWSTDFWLQPVQRKLSSDLSQISDYVTTTCSVYKKVIESTKIRKWKEVDILPIFSNIGEISHPLPLSSRMPRLVIFGQPYNKIKAYKFLHKILHFLEQIGIQEICDIGMSSDEISQLGSIPIIRMGYQDRENTSLILANSMMGFMSYRPETLTKSSIFAAYTSHGMAVLNCSNYYFSRKALIPGYHYLSFIDQETDCRLLQEVADNAHAWYQSHNLDQHAVRMVSKFSSQRAFSHCI